MSEDRQKLHDVEEIFASNQDVQLDSLRSLSATGIPNDPPWFRPTIWRLLLGSLPPEKKSWASETTKSRQRYYALAKRFLDEVADAPEPTAPLSSRDKLLDVIWKDVHRTQPRVPFFSQSMSSSPHSPFVLSSTQSTSPDEEPTIFEPITSGDALSDRLRLIRNGNKHTQATPDITLTVDEIESPSISLTLPSPPLPSEPSAKSSKTLAKSVPTFPQPSHRTALLRILYIHSLLHPDQPYTQAMPSLLAPIYYVLAASQADFDEVAVAHAEADAFWAFGELVGDMGAFIGEIGSEAGDEGVRGVLRTFSDRLKWADEELWLDLKRKSLDPALPYYSYRWIACLISQSFPLASVIRLWDFILAQPPATPTTNPRLSFLVDICTSMILRLRARLLVCGSNYKGGLWGTEPAPSDTIEPNGIMGEGFVEGMRLLQEYPIDVIGLDSIIQGAWWLAAKEKREAEEKRRRVVAAAAPGRFAIVGAQLRDTVWRGITNDSAELADQDPGVSPGASPSPSPLTKHPPLVTDGEDSSNSSREEEVHSDATFRPTRPTSTPSSRIRHYAEAFTSSDTAATLAKARSNLTAVALDAWNRPSVNVISPPTSPPVSTSGERRGSFKGWGASWGLKTKLWGSGTTQDTNPAQTQSATHNRAVSPPVNYSSSDGLSPRTQVGRASPRPQSIYSPPPRPEHFASPRDSVLFHAPPKWTGGDDNEPPPSSSWAVSPKRSSIPAALLSLGISPASPTPTPLAPKSGPRPLILSAQRVTRDTASLSRQSSVSSTSSHRPTGSSFSPRSDSDTSSSRVVPLRANGRRRIVPDSNRASPSTSPSSVSGTSPPPLPAESPSARKSVKHRPSPLETSSLVTPLRHTSVDQVKDSPSLGRRLFHGADSPNTIPSSPSPPTPPLPSSAGHNAVRITDVTRGSSILHTPQTSPRSMLEKSALKQPRIEDLPTWQTNGLAPSENESTSQSAAEGISPISHRNNTTPQPIRIRSKRTLQQRPATLDTSTAARSFPSSVTPVGHRAPSPNNLSPGDALVDTDRDHAPLTPRPSPPLTSRQDYPFPVSPGSIKRTKSPRPSGAHRIRKTSRTDTPKTVEDVPLMMSEEEGVKADDEDDYGDLLSAYETDDGP